MIELVKKQEYANCITHSGTMHADEVFATAFLSLYKGNIKVFRTNEVDKRILNEKTLVYDVGRGEFDHHQLDARKRSDGITYSSFGLLWDKFGKDFLRKENFENIDSLWEFIDKDFVEAIDADDNGVFPKVEVQSNYKVKTLSTIIKLFNPSFDSDETENEQFIKAVNIARSILEEEILYANGKVLADKKINNYLDELPDSAKYMILDNFLPYEDTILNRKDKDNILFVAFPSNRGGYAIKTIAKSIEDKTHRLSFPEEWAGLSNEELEEKSGIKGLRFCHIGRFIVTCDTYETTIKVLEKLCNEHVK